MRESPSTAPRTKLWASLSEGRPPHEGEVESFAAKVWQDSYRRDSALEWKQVEVGSPLHRKAIAAALAALGAPPARLVRDGS